MEAPAAPASVASTSALGDNLDPNQDTLTPHKRNVRRVVLQTPDEASEADTERVKDEPLEESEAGSSRHPPAPESVYSNRSFRSIGSVAESVSNPLIDADIQNLSQVEADRLQAVYLAKRACEDAERSLSNAETALVAATLNLEEMRKERANA